MKQLSLLFLFIIATCFKSLDSASICTVIDQEGTYQFGGMTGDPTDVDDSLICIRANNVDLDLGNGVYSQVNGNTVAGFNCITIDPGFTNIKIHDGTLNVFTGVGIEVGDGCNDIRFENIDILNCEESGILFNGTSMNPITNGTISSCFIDSCNGASGGVAYGLRLVRADNVAVEDCILSNNDAATNNSGFGASLEFCTSCRLTNCKAEGNGGDVLGAGISLSNSDWTVVENCNVINTIARDGAGRAIGYLADTCSFTSMIACLSTHNSNLIGEAHGFQALDGTDNSYMNCVSRNNVGAIVGSGFMLGGTESGSSIFKCKSRANNGGVAGAGYGILIDGADHSDVWYNQLVGNTGLIGIGLADTVTNSTNLYAGNVSFNNTTTGFEVFRTSGEFPSESATVGNFAAVRDISKYINIDFTA